MVINNYMNWLKEENLAEKTIQEYPVILKKLITWYEDTEGSFEPGKVTTLHIHEFVTYLNKSQYEPAYINKIIASLKTFYRYALEKELSVINPMAKVKIKASMKKHAAPKWMTKLELAKFNHAIESNKNRDKTNRDRAICNLMSQAGLRVQEVSDLNMSDICLESRRENVTVRSGKGGKYRIVPLNRDIIDSLFIFIKEQRQNVEANEPVFISQKNTRITDRAMRYMVEKYANIAGIKNISCHSLRHTFGKNLADSGVRLEQIGYLMGHDSLETTKRYLLPSENDLRRNVELLSEKKD